MDCGIPVDPEIVEFLEVKVVREVEPRRFARFRRICARERLNPDASTAEEAAMLFVRVVEHL